MDHKAIQIRSFRKGQPRAYAAGPECYTAIPERDLYYIYSHVDYKGEYFVPPDAELQDAEQAKKIGSMLWAGGWSNPITVVPQNRHGVALPADFKAKTHHTLKQNHLGDNPKRPYRFFMAGGETLAALDQLAKDKEIYSQRITAMLDTFKKLTPLMLAENAVPGITKAQDIYFNSSVATDPAGRPVLRVSPRREGTGEVLPLLNCSAFTAITTGHNEYIILPNMASEQGRALQDSINAVPNKLRPHDFPAALLNTDHVIAADKLDGAFGPLNQPLIRHFPEGIVLAYRVNGKGRDSFTPAGCTEISQAAFLWMEMNYNDAVSGTRPPPPAKKNFPFAPKP
jgi:hypothetical protein